MKNKIKVQNKKLIKAVREQKTPYVICPECNRGGMEKDSAWGCGWRCLFKDCNYYTSAILSVEEVEELFVLKNQLRLIKEFKI